jgi:hypothetical protein
MQSPDDVRQAQRESFVLGQEKNWRKICEGPLGNALINLSEINFNDKFKFEEHRQVMYDVIFNKSPKNVDSHLRTKRFE